MTKLTHQDLLNTIERDLESVLTAFNSVTGADWKSFNSQDGGPLFISETPFERIPDYALRIMVSDKMGHGGFHVIRKYIRLDWWGWPSLMVTGKNEETGHPPFTWGKSNPAPRGSAFNFKRATPIPGQLPRWDYNDEGLRECVTKHLRIADKAHLDSLNYSEMCLEMARRSASTA